MTGSEELVEAFGLGDEQVSVTATDREEHATDYGTSAAAGSSPDIVVWPESTTDVANVLVVANERGVSVTPYAAGTSTEGNAVPVAGGISLDLTRMNGVLDVRPEDFQIDVEPGILGSAVEDRIGECGLFFPPFPQSRDISTIGGMIANDASGTRTVKYGEVGDWVLELEAVLADGSVIEVGSKAAKTSSGYNLKDLLVGSEGTLGIVTRATLALAPEPREIRGGRALFDSVDDAASAISDTISAGVNVATIELLDTLTARIATAYTGADLPDCPMVFVEFHGNYGLDPVVEECATIFERHGVREFTVAADERGMDDLWRARRELAHALVEYDPDREPLMIGDVTVPISQYPALIHAAREIAAEYSFEIPCFGHAGDGNVHYTVLVDPDDDEARTRGWEAADAIVDRAIGMGGSCTGEHGIGIGKRKYMHREHGEAALLAMQSVKRALDPNGILNPGKIFPDA